MRAGGLADPPALHLLRSFGLHLLNGEDRTPCLFWSISQCNLAILDRDLARQAHLCLHAASVVTRNLSVPFASLLRTSLVAKCFPISRWTPVILPVHATPARDVPFVRHGSESGKMRAWRREKAAASGGCHREGWGKRRKESSQERRVGTVGDSGVWQVGAASVHSTVAANRPGPVKSSIAPEDERRLR